MATQVQWRGGSTLEHSTFTGAPKEITVDTSKKTLVVHDGVTVGGYPLAREDDLINRFTGVIADFFGSVDPSTDPTNGIIPGAVWADTVSQTIKRRNAANDGWIIEGRLFKSSLPIIEAVDVPTVDIGPIHIVGQGPAEWNTITNTYIPIGGGAQGGGADKVFWVNDSEITEDFTVETGKRAGTFGPVAIQPGVVVTVEPDAVWTIV